MDTGGIHHAQASITFLAPLVCTKRLSSRTAQRPLGLEGKVADREAPLFPRRGHIWWCISWYGRRGVSRLLLRTRTSRSKLGGAQWIGMKLMSHLQPQVPEPLIDDLPRLLPGRRVTTPAVGVLFLVFIGKDRFKSATMQVEGDDIGSGESALGKIREEEFIDDTRAGDTDWALPRVRRMGCHHHAAALSRWPHRHIRTIVERAHQITFRAYELLIGWQVQAALDLRSLQHCVVFAARHIGEACQIGDDSPRAILPIQPQQDQLLWQAIRLAVEPYRGHCPAQFFPVESVARVGERAEPLRGMCLRDGRAGADNFPALAPGVAGSAHLIQSTLGSRQFRDLWQGALAGSLAGAIDVKDHSLFACSINQSSCLPFFVQWAREQVFEKERAQGFDRWLGETGKKATERRARGQALPSEERHEGRSKGMQALVEGFQRPFVTDGIAEEHGHKVNHVVVAEAATGKAHALTDGGKDTLLAKVLGHQGDFPEPGWRRGHGLARGLDDHRSISNTVHVNLLDVNGFVLPQQGDTFLSWLATCYNLVAQLVGL